MVVTSDLQASKVICGVLAASILGSAVLLKQEYSDLLWFLGRPTLTGGAVVFYIHRGSILWFSATCKFLSSVLAVDRRSIHKCWEITRSRSAIYASPKLLVVDRQCTRKCWEIVRSRLNRRSMPN